MFNETEKYQQCLDFLFGFVDYSLTKNFGNLPGLFDLQRMQDFLTLLGNPHLKIPIFHVAGTKGKGSTAAIIASVLRSSGFKTGFYTSPHLIDFAERIQINNEPISHLQLVDLVEEIKPYISRVKKLTTFEIITALGFLYFTRCHVEVAVVEVGLGGRLDATNVVDPLVSIITSISYDHTNVLGNSITEIATEKAGIIKTGKPVVCAPQKYEALKIIEKVCAEQRSRLTIVGRDYFYALESKSIDNQNLLIWKADEQSLMNQVIEGGETTSWHPVRLSLPLLGYHQLENAATAYAAIQTAVDGGMKIEPSKIADGFRNVFWPGRFEFLRKEPAIIVDSAHNRDSALKLRIALDDYLPGQNLIMVIGASEDKDIDGIFAELAPKASIVIATQTIHPRAASPELLIDIAHHWGLHALAISPVEVAIEKALELSNNTHPILVTGSIFLAAAVREIWQKSGHPLRNY